MLHTPSGQERIIEITTKRELLQLLSAGFDCLRQIEQADEIRRAREAGAERGRVLERMMRCGKDGRA